MSNQAARVKKQTLTGTFPEPMHSGLTKQTLVQLTLLTSVYQKTLVPVTAKATDNMKHKV